MNPSKNMRLRYFLRHPEQMKGRYEFMRVLTARTDLGIEFVEGWQVTRIAVAILLPVLGSLILGVCYSVFAGDVSGAFTTCRNLERTLSETHLTNRSLASTTLLNDEHDIPGSGRYTHTGAGA